MSPLVLLHPFAPTHPLQLVLGLVLWSLWFVVIYGGLSVACAVAPPVPEQGALTGINIGLGLLTLATTSLLLEWSRNCYREASRHQSHRRFIALSAAGLHLFAAAGVVFVGLPVVVLPPCL